MSQSITCRDIILILRWIKAWRGRAALVQVVESYCLWPKGPGFESRSPRITQTRVRLATDTLPQTPHREGALWGTPFVLNWKGRLRFARFILPANILSFFYLPVLLIYITITDIYSTASSLVLCYLSKVSRCLILYSVWLHASLNSSHGKN